MENASLLLIPFFEQSCYFVASENGERSFTYVDACDQYPDKLSERSNVVSLSFNNTYSLPAAPFSISLENTKEKSLNSNPIILATLSSPPHYTLTPEDFTTSSCSLRLLNYNSTAYYFEVLVDSLFCNIYVPYGAVESTRHLPNQRSNTLRVVLTDNSRDKPVLVCREGLSAHSSYTISCVATFSFYVHSF